MGETRPLSPKPPLPSSLLPFRFLECGKFEVYFSRFPVIADFAEDGGDQAEQGIFVGEQVGDPCSAFDFLIESFEHVSGPQSSPVRRRGVEYRESLRDVVFDPFRESGSGVLVLVNQTSQFLFRVDSVGRVEDLAEIGSDFTPHGDVGNVVERILDQMELASLPGDPWEAGDTGLFDTGMIIADDHLDTMQSSFDERLEEVPPMDFRFAETDTDPEDLAFSLFVDADGDQDSAVPYCPGMADFFVTCVTDQIGRASQRPFSPRLEFCVEEFSSAADLRAADIESAELASDFGDLSGGDPLDVHFGDGEFECPFAPLAALEGRGVEIDVSSLGDTELKRSEAAVDGFGLEAVGISLTGFGPLPRVGPENFGPFEFHGLVHEDFDGLSHSVKSIFGEELDNVAEAARLFCVGHVRSPFSLCEDCD